MKKFLLALLFLTAIGLPRFASAGDECAALSQDACFESKDCWLDCGAVRNHRCVPYLCRAKKRCEEGLSQAGLKKESCEARPGCVYTPPSCYCPQGLACYCGGGPPAQCSEKGK